MLRENIYLSKWEKGDFLPIEGYGYGGNQHWWQDFKARNGCGPVTAANITAYLADKDSLKYGPLYEGLTLSKEDFIIHMTSLYQILKPGKAGLLSMNKYDKKVKEFALSKGVVLASKRMSFMASLEASVSFIKEGLKADTPVAVLNLNKFYKYGWHWMTITAYDYKDSRHYVYVANNNKQISLDFEKLRKAIRCWGGGYIYFE